MMLSDTLSFKAPLEFYYVIKMLENIFNIPVEIVRCNGVQKIYHKKSPKYVESMGRIKLGKYSYITILEYKKKATSKNSCFIEFHGLQQYHQDGTPIFLDVEEELKELIKAIKLTLWRIELPIDIMTSFVEVSKHFPDYEKPYTTTYEYEKGSTKFQLYDKRAKDNLEVDITRLEMKKSYSRKRTPIVLSSLEELKEIELDLVSQIELEIESKSLNVYTPLTKPLHTVSTANQKILDEVEKTIGDVKKINLTLEEITGINIIADKIEIHTKEGIIIYHYENYILQFPASLLLVANKLLEKPPTNKELQENYHIK